MSPVDVSQLAKHKLELHKRYPDAMHIGTETPYVERISTSSIELDLAMGGGVPMGRWSRFYGPYMSSKSLMCWNVVRIAQEMGLKCAYYNIEQQFEKKLVESLGVDTDELEIVEGTTIEGIGHALQLLFGSVHMHILDSLSAAVSVDELNAGMEEWRPGLSARAWGKVFHNVGPFFDKQDNTVIMVDQVRDVFAMGRGAAKSTKPEPPGGRYINHQSSMNLHFQRGAWLFRDESGALQSKAEKQAEGETISELLEPDGIEVLVRCEKSRVSRPFRAARLALDFANMRFDSLYELTKAAVHHEVVNKSSSWYTTPSGKKVQGMKGLRAVIAEEPELRVAIQQAVARAW